MVNEEILQCHAAVSFSHYLTYNSQQSQSSGFRKGGFKLIQSVVDFVDDLRKILQLKKFL